MSTASGLLGLIISEQLDNANKTTSSDAAFIQHIVAPETGVAGIPAGKIRDRHHDLLAVNPPRD
jgi:hypothetical protein